MMRKIFPILFVFTTITLHSQKQQYIGVGINSEIPSGDNIKVGYGISYENQLSKHSGFEVDLNYRSRIQNMNISIPTSGIENYPVQINESYLSLPVLYKYYSNIVNISTGFTIDYFMRGKNLTNLGNVELDLYNIDPKLYVGWVFKVGKSIKLSSKFILEPEVQFNPIFKYGYSYSGASVKLKYKL